MKNNQNEFYLGMENNVASLLRDSHDNGTIEMIVTTG